MDHLIEEPRNASTNERRRLLERIARNAPPKRSRATLDLKAKLQLSVLLKPAPDLKIPALDRLVLNSVRAVRSDYLRPHAGSRNGKLSGEMRVLKSEPWIECNDQLKALERSSGDFAQAVRDLSHMAKTQSFRSGSSLDYLATLDERQCRQLLRLQGHAGSVIERIAQNLPEKPTHQSVKIAARLFYLSMEEVYSLATAKKVTTTRRAGDDPREDEDEGEGERAQYDSDWVRVLVHS